MQPTHKKYRDERIAWLIVVLLTLLMNISHFQSITKETPFQPDQPD